MGLSLLAFLAGARPKIIPMAAEKPNASKMVEAEKENGMPMSSAAR
jgi:hypothetical protein